MNKCTVCLEFQNIIVQFIFLKYYVIVLCYQTLFFADGERYKYINVTIFDDEIPEGDERFQLILTNPSFGLELGENTTGNIKDVNLGL